MKQLIYYFFFGITLIAFEGNAQQISRQLQSSSPSLLDFRNYIAPTLEFNDALLQITQKWPDGGNLPGRALRSQLFSLLFFLPSAALNDRYQQAISQMINQVIKLPNGFGQLSYVSYTKDEFGVPDVTSLRVSNKGIGKTPEESYAFGTSNMTIPYEVFRYGDIQGHYIWIYKDVNGVSRFGTIRQPYIDAFLKRAFAYREDILENVKTFELQNDRIIESYKIADIWASKAQEHKVALTKKNVWNRVDSLNSLMKQKQEELNQLEKEESEIAAKRQTIACAIGFIDACQALNIAAGDLFNKSGAGEKASYQFQNDYLKPQQVGIQSRKNRLGIDIDNIQMYLRPFYKSINAATPDSKFKPKQIIIQD